MPRVVHFEISAENPESTIKFYEETFGWKFEKWDGPMEYWMIRTGEGPGIDGGLTRREPTTMDINTVGVEDLDAYVEKVKSNGGTIIMPRMAVPGVGWWAVFQDLEGNKFGIMQEDPAAE